MKEAKILNDLYNFLKWILPIVAKYPRSYRFTLGTRIENCLYEIMEQLQRAYYVKQKRDSLDKSSLGIEHLRLLLRLSHELHLFDQKIHYAIIQQLDGIGKQLGGWMKTLQDN